MTTNRKPRIALVTSVVDNRGGRGTALVAREFLDRLSRYTDDFDFILIHHEPTDDPLYARFPTLCIPHLPKPFDRQMFREAWFWLQLWARGERYDVLHYLNPRVWPSYLLSPARRICITVFEAGVMLNFHKPGMSDRVFQFTNRYLHHRMHRLIVTSMSGKIEVAETFRVDPERIVVMPLGVNPRFAPVPVHQEAEKTLLGYGISRPYILSVNRLDPHKNILRLVEAFAALSTEYPAHTLVLVGGKHLPEYSAQVISRIRELTMGSRIHLAPFIPEADLPLVYSAADLMIYPSFHEGFGLPILESMACGTPVATANVSASPETAGGAAQLFDPYDQAAITDAMRQVLKDPALRASLRARGQARAKMFTWEHMCDVLADLYRSLAKG